MQGAPGQLGECASLDQGTVLRHAVAVFLALGGVPDVVGKLQMLHCISITPPSHMTITKIQGITTGGNVMEGQQNGWQQSLQMVCMGFGMVITH